MKNRETDHSRETKNPSKNNWKNSKLFNVGESSRQLAKELAELRKQEDPEKTRIAEGKEEVRRYLTRVSTVIKLLEPTGLTKEVASIKLMHDNITFFMEHPKNMAFHKDNPNDHNDFMSYVEASKDLFIEAGKVRFIARGFGHISTSKQEREDILNKLDKAIKETKIQKYELIYFLISANNIERDNNNLHGLGFQATTAQTEKISEAIKNYLADTESVKNFMKTIKNSSTQISRQSEHAFRNYNRFR
jgi:hypothetical protein